jgi:hypothetical protein
VTRERAVAPRREAATRDFGERKRSEERKGRRAEERSSDLLLHTTRVRMVVERRNAACAGLW